MTMTPFELAHAIDACGQQYIDEGSRPLEALRQAAHDLAEEAASRGDSLHPEPPAGVLSALNLRRSRGEQVTVGDAMVEAMLKLKAEGVSDPWSHLAKVLAQHAREPRC